MKPATAQYISVGITLMFAIWIVWLWVNPDQVEKVQKPMVEKQTQPQAQAEPTPPTKPMTFVLPAPPKPKVVAKTPVVAAVVQEVVKEDKPVVKEASKPIEKQVEAPIEKPKPAPKKEVVKKVVPKPEPVEEIVQVTPTQAVGGRALLRVLEHGKGPQIEIAWPANAGKREGLYDRLRACFGMKNALMDAQGNLFRSNEVRGQRWEINLDRFSGFLRQASGRLPRKEQQISHAIERRHGHLNDPVMVRIFPRRVDASLLGGLQAIVGSGYMQARSIHARYDMQGSHILVRDIQLDGRKLEGVIELSQYRQCGGRA